jgi:hypothetical protein
MSRNRHSEVFPYEKTCEGVPHSSIGSRATPTECARAHPRAVEPPPQTIPSGSLRGSGATVDTNFRVIEEGDLMVCNDQNRTDD